LIIKKIGKIIANKKINSKTECRNEKIFENIQEMIAEQEKHKH